jgi:hypothetical protein
MHDVHGEWFAPWDISLDIFYPSGFSFRARQRMDYLLALMSNLQAFEGACLAREPICGLDDSLSYVEV